MLKVIKWIKCTLVAREWEVWTIAHEPIAASPQRSHSPTPCRRQGVRPAVVLQQSPGVRHVMHRRCCAELHPAVVAAAHIHAHAHAHVIAVATYCEHSASQPCMVLSQWPPGHASLMEVDLTPSPRRSINNSLELRRPFLSRPTVRDAPSPADQHQMSGRPMTTRNGT